VLAPPGQLDPEPVVEAQGQSRQRAV
jgi:hypothetical protein